MTEKCNLTALKRNIGNRIRQALHQLQQNLRSLDRSPVPQRVPVAAGRSRPRLAAPRYGNMARFSGLRAWCPREVDQGSSGSSSFTYLMQSRPYCQKLQCSRNGLNLCGLFSSQLHSSGLRTPHVFGRSYSTYSKIRSQYWTWRPSQISQSFSHRSQFRMKSYSSFNKMPTLTELLKKKVGTHEDAFARAPCQAPVSTAIRNTTPSCIWLNASLTQKFHDTVMSLARSEPTMGSYVDFALEPKVCIPSATILHADVLQQILANLQQFEQHVAHLQKDLVRLSELGELPLKHLATEKVIRVYFPNTDRQQLERLLMEKNIRGGVVYEDTTGQCHNVHSDESISCISDFDLLSSCGSQSTDSGSGASSDYDQVLSSDSELMMPDDHIVHVEPVLTSHRVDIAEDAWAY